jgi:D-proline reductase (dithiol) PrdB
VVAVLGITDRTLSLAVTHLGRSGYGRAMNGDQAMRSHSAGLPAPTFPNPAWVTPVALADATVAIVTSAALHVASDEAFSAGDTGYRLIDRHRRDLVLGHWSPNFDRTGVTMDLNVVYPIDRLEELADRGVIGRVAPRHVSFAGNQPDDVATIRLDTGPAAAAALREDGVDVVLLTPV